jgi:hypothetical protein
MECLRLRLGGLDISRRTVRVLAGKGGKDRVTVMPGPPGAFDTQAAEAAPPGLSLANWRST